MGDRSNIEWTDATWNPVRGCSRVSEGCRHCYAERVAGRFSGPGQPYEGLARRGRGAGGGGGARWTGEVRLVPEHLADPLRWTRPRRVFVNSMSDLFHEGLSNEDIAAVFGVMAAAPRHTFQVLTKRPQRMREWFEWLEAAADIRAVFPDDDRSWRRAHLLRAAIVRHCPLPKFPPTVPDIEEAGWPLPNVWLGVSVEDQATADERIPLLLATPAAVRFVSYEPALAPVDFSYWLDPAAECGRSEVLDWIIAGSESGPGARPAELDWFRAVRDQCAAAGVSFFFKQWVGVTRNGGRCADDGARAGFDRARGKVSLPVLDGRQHAEWPIQPRSR